ncbi:MAG TPA: potassium channel family protein [Conexibacter sp.]|nr:potassium channel family protein [Conexibacter sp.]
MSVPRIPPPPASASFAAPVELPGGREQTAGQRIARRVVIAVAVIVFVAIVTYLGRDGYVDAAGGTISLLDAFYYATVTVTTTGYGDVRPESDTARLVTTILVTPARVLFLIVLVGTTLELLAERTRAAYRLTRWRKTLKNHTIVCGFGTKGQSAVDELRARGVAPSELLIIDPRAEARERAVAAGLAAIAGDAGSVDVLRQAGVEQAAAVVVAPDRDDAAVLITLTARELNPDATIVAAVREEENAHLLRQGGADNVITSSGAAGRLLAMGIRSPTVATVLEDLLVGGEGLDLMEYRVERDGMTHAEAADGAPVIAVVRDRTTLRFDDPRAQALQEGDHLICLCGSGVPPAGSG